MATLFVCSIEGCGKLSTRKHFCHKHYRRLRRYGDPHVVKKLPDGEKKRWLDDRSSYRGDDCLIWPYKLYQKQTACVVHQGKHVNIFRYMCEAAHGPSPVGDYEAAHSCGKRHLGCVNPSHLRWATPKENTGDKFAHGTVHRGSQIVSAKLTEADVLQIKALKGVENFRVVAKRFNVHPASISFIWAGRTWRHV